MDSLSYRQSELQLTANAFIRRVYNWMGAGLAITGITSYAVANSPEIQNAIFGSRIVFFGLILGQLAMVFIISSQIFKMRPATAALLFVAYSALNGATLSSIFLVYAASTITSTFLVCALTFVACSIYGYTTQRDLTSMGGFMTMGLIGIIVASIVNLFFKSNEVSMVISYIGVLVFVGLTAYDTQDIKRMALAQPEGVDSGAVRKGAILGALKLYLDFVNLFLMLLRILGSRRE